MQKYSISTTDEYDEWLENETLKSQLQIDKRLEKIKSEGHFGHINDNLGERLSELKFNDGRRIYYVIIPIAKVILLLGGNKNGQDKAIKRAKSILRKIIQIGSQQNSRSKAL